MRLLHALTHRLAEFPEDVHLPEYAILSHVRYADEPTLQDMKTAQAPHRRGYKKLLGACRQALRDGFEWIWIDTVCVDHTSPAEVSEAVNSMWRWYEESGICYVYLTDVPRFYFGDSQWFERSWTLIELIAPRDVEFYTADWTEIGTKSSLETEISSITGIRQDILRGASPATCSVAERLSWAAHRQSAKIEDQAYSLMGLFGINMPIIYGEGRKAWMRIQELILEKTEDLSLLAWSPNMVSESAADADINRTYSGCLAPSPSSFGRPDLSTYLPSTAFGFDDADSIMYPDVTALEWRDVQRHVSRSSSSKSSQFAYPPPAINNRGIELTLLIDTTATEPADTSDSDALETEVLAWLYTDVVTSGTLSPVPMGSSLSDSSVSISRRALMVCVWMTVYRPSRSWSGQLWARRTPSKSPVAVPMMFRNRFQPRKMFLQRSANKVPAAPSWKTASVEQEDITRKMEIRIISDMETAPLRIISHYPEKAKLTHPQPAKAFDGSLSDIPATDFQITTKTGIETNASGALKFFFMDADPSSDAQFVVIFGQKEDTGEAFCHAEQTDLRTDAGERPFKRSWSPEIKGGMSGVGRSGLTDRSFILLECGVAVVAMTKRRRDRKTGVYSPTLIVACYKDGRKFFEAAGREAI